MSGPLEYEDLAAKLTLLKSRMEHFLYFSGVKACPVIYGLIESDGVDPCVMFAGYDIGVMLQEYVPGTAEEPCEIYYDAYVVGDDCDSYSGPNMDQAIVSAINILVAYKLKVLLEANSKDEVYYGS